MYYDAKIENGELWVRNTHKQPWWEQPGGDMSSVAHHLSQLTDEERLTIFSLFCTHCGKITNDVCHCMNDE